jgi:hypothetical protein
MNKRVKNKTKVNLSRLNGHLPAIAPVAPIKIDLGCGSNKRQDNGPWTGVDSIDFPGVDVVCDLASGRWLWDDSTVTEAHASHFLEHLTNLNDKWERVHFFNELYRVLIPGGKATIIIPHWCSNRYYGDPTHKEAFSEMGFFYLLREWRLGDPAKNLVANAPHTDIKHNPNGYSCDFDATWGYTIHPAFQVRNAETQQFAFAWYKEAIQDLVATLTAKK